jgi:hypothetical protein
MRVSSISCGACSFANCHTFDSATLHCLFALVLTRRRCTLLFYRQIADCEARIEADERW